MTKKKIKVLNLYAGIGGNRKLWKDCEVIAVENNPEIAFEFYLEHLETVTKLPGVVLMVDKHRNVPK